MLLLAFLLQGSTLPIGVQWYAIAHLASPYQFDYIGWELNALATKASQTLWGVHAYVDEAARVGLVRAYFDDLRTAQQLEARIAALYTQPDLADPDAASADLRVERDTLRAQLVARQPHIEAILEGQVASVLVAEGFGTLGQLLPPMAMHFTQVPNLLVVSPRDAIRMEVSINVTPLSVEQRAALEQRIEQAHDVAALIVPLGGIALYPAMILETSDLEWALETFAHEWLHHYLYFFPLGLQYDFDNETRIINESLATTFGQEVGKQVYARYYADSATTQSSIQLVTQQPQTTPPRFDFAAEMNTTRVTLDAYLAAGDVEAAERYLVERRALFVANGYAIRRLNQAYFAFYGGYQGGAVPGVEGDDPIGSSIRAIRARSASLHDFVVAMRGITTRDQLLHLRDTLTTQNRKMP